ncbi:MAG: hypothetical protein JJK57_09720 [Komagataeibacter hansenii]|uniref:hypothetical protein n=1 Tax=Komagataeibacter saccharivorans TaxID=265959 RepID=UPI0011B60504|nr:hypothetical protein [Komagataeibacter saccharivorans]MBL7236828.1 hypothetical protein [Novacetimonas hansenii]GBQ34328.1 hypothetical protein AA0614_0118 [Komagataeibacter saccharivorans NRIC 0614]
MIPYSVVESSIKRQDNAVIIPEAMFRFLITEYLRSLPFDEAAYLKANPDVDAAIHRDEFSSGKEHFTRIGFFEGRDAGGDEFDEKWYLKNNRDVASSVNRGDWSSGEEHWQRIGRNELRAPCRAQVPLYDIWHAFLKSGQNRQP